MTRQERMRFRRLGKAKRRAHRLEKRKARQEQRRLHPTDDLVGYTPRRNLKASLLLAAAVFILAALAGALVP